MKIVSLGSALQDIYLIDRDDFAAGIISSAYAINDDSADRAIFAELTIGTKVDIDRISYEVGGGGTNSATTFARYGHDAYFIGNIGRDTAGQAVLDCLDREGINNSYVYFAPRQKTGCSVILLDSRSGERTILTHRGASAKFDNLSAQDLREIQPDWLYISSVRGDLRTLEAFCKTARDIGTKIMFNPGKLELDQPKELRKILRYVNILLLNKSEAQCLVNGTVLTELLDRLANYVETVIITDGQMGAIATDHKQTFRVGLYEDLRVKDTTGAGDAFGSGFLAALAGGKSFKQSLVFASANSTFVVNKLGAKAGILTGHEKLHQMPIQEVK